MKKVTSSIGFLLMAVMLLGLDTTVEAQDLDPSRRKSPLGIARLAMGDTYVKVHYGRPYMRGREIFGGLVSYDEIWRTGANEGTEFTATKDIMVAGKKLPAGTYTIFTVPGEQEWEIRFSPQLGLWATGVLDPVSRQMTPNVYDPAMDQLTVRVQKSDLADGDDPIRQFTIRLRPHEDGGIFELSWERTSVEVPISAAN